jgi:hypothetical protein
MKRWLRYFQPAGWDDISDLNDPVTAINQVFDNCDSLVHQDLLKIRIVFPKLAVRHFRKKRSSFAIPVIHFHSASA